ncbi:MAG: hypothetical protein LBD48_01020 [Treponema sp.]|jgi:hypothetical protein|nr:hypothetical protein [Treponema sp.]
MEGEAVFDLAQNRNGERRLFDGCRARGFELRFNRGEAVHLKLDICGEFPPVVYSYAELALAEGGERFIGGCVTYRINGNWR